MSALRTLPRAFTRLPRSSLARLFTTTAAAAPSVRIIEVGPRDGLQNEPITLPLPIALEFISALAFTGLRTIECGSFVSSRAIPQMSSTPSILAHYTTKPPARPTTHSYLVPNTQGLKYFLSHKPDPKQNEIAIFASASEGFSRRNLRCSVEESLQRFRKVAEEARGKGYRVRGYVSMVIECPYSGPTPAPAVVAVVRELLGMGCYEVSLGDTTGVATPAAIRTLLKHLKAENISPKWLAGHFHDTYGMAIANVAAAWEEGVRAFDSSVAGLGGCPYARGASGNLATEDLVWFLEAQGVRTGVNLGALAEAGAWITGVLGRKNESRVGRTLVAKRREEEGSVKRGEEKRGEEKGGEEKRGEEKRTLREEKWKKEERPRW